MIWRKITLLLSILLLWGTVFAQPGVPETTQEATRSAQALTLIPAQITSGSTLTLLTSANIFRAGQVVRLRGYGDLTPTVQNETTLTVTIPPGVPPASYEVLVRDSGGVVARSSVMLLVETTVNPPQEQVPTPYVGRPSLVARNFNVNPSQVAPGETVIFSFEVVNQGLQTAQGVTASLDSGGAFVPAAGQSAALLPDIPPGATGVVSLSAVATSGAEAGPTSVPITISYRDFSGENYTAEAQLGVTIRRVTQVPQLSLARYQYNPTPARPGEALTLTVLITNTGTETASQAQLRVAGDGVLLAGPQGDLFPLGELEPGASVGLDIPLIVSPGAAPGPQAQPFTITFVQDNEAQQVESSMTINVARVVENAPTMLLRAYEVDRDPLEPGTRFLFAATVRNAGDVNALGMLVTFGTVESSGGGEDDDGSGGSGSSSTSTTPSTTFAPLGTGGTLFVGDVAAQSEVTFAQEFIVNSSVNTGIYSLPITLRYMTEDGESVQDNLRASVVVIEPPELTLTDQSSVAESVNVGEPFFIALEIVNTGSADLELTTGTASAENGEVIEGAETVLGMVAGDDSTVYSAGVIPAEEGPVTVTVILRYLDDLNTEREIVRIYQTTAVMPPPPVEEEPVLEIPLEPTPEPQEENWLGRLLLGLLGLGS